MDKYKKILKLLNEGKTLQVLVEDVDFLAGCYDRLRILEGNTSSFVWIEEPNRFIKSCFTENCDAYFRPKTPEQLVNNMRHYDTYQKLKIKSIKVV